jgi:hypothetical protein
VRNASSAPTLCLNSSVTASLDTGALHAGRFNGEGLEPTWLEAVPALAALRAGTRSACGRLNALLTRWPVAVLLGSATLSSASPAVETAFADVEARSSFATPGVMAPNAAGVPGVQARRRRDAGADGPGDACTVSVNERSPSPRDQRETSPP